VSVRRRQLATVMLVLGLTVGGFFVSRAHGEQDANHDSKHRADIAATQLRDRVVQAETLMDGLSRFLVGNDSSGVTTEQFTDSGARWLSPVGLPAARVERVSATERARYERRIGQRIVESTPSGGLARARPRRSYLPATLVTRIPPMSVPGVDLGGTSGIAAAVARPQTAYRVTATSLGQLPDGTAGLFLVQSAQRLNRGIVEPGFVVLFLPASWLLAAAADTVDSNPTSNPGLKIKVGGASAGNLRGATAGSSFTAAGQRFDVRVPRSEVDGNAEVLPWIILAAGLVLAALAGALGVIAARRAKAKAEVDRLFTISPDLIVVQASTVTSNVSIRPSRHASVTRSKRRLGDPISSSFTRTIASGQRRTRRRSAKARRSLHSRTGTSARAVCTDGSSGPQRRSSRKDGRTRLDAT
jgi:hypothetical protein